MKKILIIIANIFLLGLTNVSTANPEILSQVLPQDSRVPGGIAVIPLSMTSNNSQIKFNDKPVWQIVGKEQSWAILAIPLKQKPGKVNYLVGDQVHSFEVKNKAYKEQHLTVKRKHSNPPADQIKRIQKESRLSREAFERFSDINKNMPYQNLLLPTTGPISSPFGLKRFFNEQARRPHSGIDIAAPRGTDIIAPMDGEIVLTGNFFFNGNSIFIDHGQGLVTMYCHMDKLESQQGQSVKAGDVIGKVGSTGRATGPHLHWTVSLNNTRIEPLLFIDKSNSK
jgi:murein DD-endopeptidase MepM/ murein hydrolase activator NlpD